jgi:poly(3-hydroxyalkanoate) depolymerase
VTVLDGVQESSVHVDGQAMRVLRTGTADPTTPPLLLINGIGASIEMWAPLVTRLGSRETIAFDLPGSGTSPPARRPARMQGIAATVTGLLDALGCGRVDVLGYSFGGIVAQELARRAPERVDRLVLCATSPGFVSVPPHPVTMSLMLTPARYHSRSLAKLIVPVIAGGRTRRDPAALRDHLGDRLAKPPPLLGYLHQTYAATGWSSFRWLGTVRQPTLILHGDDDPLIPLVNARWMARLMPNAQLHVLRGAGHLFLMDEPASALSKVNGFLARGQAA